MSEKMKIDLFLFGAALLATAMVLITDPGVERMLIGLLGV